MRKRTPNHLLAALAMVTPAAELLSRGRDPFLPPPTIASADHECTYAPHAHSDIETEPAAGALMASSSTGGAGGAMNFDLRGYDDSSDPWPAIRANLEHRRRNNAALRAIQSSRSQE